MSRVLAIVALVFSALGAATLFLLGLIVSSSDLDGSVNVGAVMFGAAVALVGACIAINGLSQRSPELARSGAGAQAAAVLFLGGVYLSAPDPEGAGAALYWALALAIAVDVAVLLSAGMLCAETRAATRR